MFEGRLYKVNSNLINFEDMCKQTTNSYTIFANDTPDDNDIPNDKAFITLSMEQKYSKLTPKLSLRGRFSERIHIMTFCVLALLLTFCQFSLMALVLYLHLLWDSLEAPRFVKRYGLIPFLHYFVHVRQFAYRIIQLVPLKPPLDLPARIKGHLNHIQQTRKMLESHLIKRMY